MDLEKELKETFIEEYSSAKMLMKAGRLKSCIILLSKSLFALCDYIIYKGYGKLPKNHSERFRILQQKESQIYQIVDSVWSKYTDTYSKPSEKESYKLLNEAVRGIAENERIDEEIKNIIKE